MKNKYSRKPLRISMAVALCVPVLLAGIDKQLQGQHNAVLVTRKPIANQPLVPVRLLPEQVKTAPVLTLNTPALAFHKLVQ